MTPPEKLKRNLTQRLVEAERRRALAADLKPSDKRSRPAIAPGSGSSARRQERWANAPTAKLSRIIKYKDQKSNGWRTKVDRL
jgi:hypothetical protein